MGGWGADYADASSFTDLFVTGNSYNRGRWSNPDYDNQTSQADQAKLDEIRRRALAKLEKGKE